MFEIDLSAVKVQEKGDYKPVPVGEYELYLTDAEIKDSKAGNKYISAEFTIASGEHEKRKVFENFTLAHEVGLQRLKQMALGMGITDFKKFTPQACIGKKVKAYINIKTEEGYDPKNAIKYFVTTEKATSPAVEEDTDGLPF